MSVIDNYYFIEPGNNIDEKSPEIKKITGLNSDQIQKRWDTEKGKNILADWKRDNFSKQSLVRLVGSYYGHTDIRGISLADENLSELDLSKVDLYGSNLKNTNFEKTNLTESWLSESNIKGARFDWAIMKGALVDNVKFDNTTSFTGVNLNEVNFNLAVLLQDLALTQQRINNIKETRPLLAMFLNITCDFGRSFGRFLFWATLIIVFFGLFFYLIPEGLSTEGLGNSFYFSVVTFTTLGYGDIKPVSSIAKIAVVTEVITGYIMLGLLVAILSKKVFGN